ncbi:hypothetical protein ACFL5F_04070 [Planctomycetota bacterium]
MKTNIITTEQEYDCISSTLFPSDSEDEHFGFGLAGINRYSEGCNILLRKFIFADFSCLEKQSGGYIRPKPGFVQYVWTLAKKSHSVLIDFHTHPFCDKGVSFSHIDDNSENKSFPKAVEYLGQGPHASIVFGRNSLDARWYNPKTKRLEPVASVKIIGNKLKIITPTSSTSVLKRRS